MKMPLLAMFFASSLAMAEVPQEPVSVKKMLFNGSGCPFSSVEAEISPDLQSFDLKFSEMLAEFGPGIDPAQSRKNCIITMVLDTPEGWQYAVSRYQVNGFALLDEGVSGEQGVYVFFEGQGTTKKDNRVFRGPLSSDFKVQGDLSLMPLWSPCGVERALNMNVTVRAYSANPAANPEARGLMILDQIPQLNLMWRRCR